MNPILEKFFADSALRMKQERDEHLISLGLYETKKKYVPKGRTSVYYDESAGLYYSEVEKVAISVTDEEYARICKLVEPTYEKNGYESKLIVISKVLAAIGGIALIVVFILGIMFLVDYEEELGWTCIIGSAISTPFVILNYYLLNIFSKISSTLTRLLNR